MTHDSCLKSPYNSDGSFGGIGIASHARGSRHITTSVTESCKNRTHWHTFVTLTVWYDVDV